MWCRWLTARTVITARCATPRRARHPRSFIITSAHPTRANFAHHRQLARGYVSAVQCSPRISLINSSRRRSQRSSTTLYDWVWSEIAAAKTARLHTRYSFSKYTKLCRPVASKAIFDNSSPFIERLSTKWTETVRSGPVSSAIGTETAQGLAIGLRNRKTQSLRPHLFTCQKRRSAKALWYQNLPEIYYVGRARCENCILL